MPAEQAATSRIRHGARIDRALYTDPRLIEVSAAALAVLIAAKVWAVADQSQRVVGEEEPSAGWLLTETGEPWTEGRIAKITRLTGKQVGDAIAELRTAGMFIVSDLGASGLVGWRELKSTQRVKRYRDRRAA